MASAKRVILFFVLIVVAFFGGSHGAVHKVGDSAGWTIMGDIDYQKWASTRNFHVGDSLVFEYNNQFHNVKQVSHQDFQLCNPTNPIAAYASGSDSITLERPGHYYSICGYPGHCQAGQKLDILVTPSTLRASSSPSPSPAPYGPSPVASSPEPAQSSGAPSHHHFPRLCLALCLLVFCVGGFAF